MTAPVTGDGPFIVRHLRVPEVDGGTGWVLHVEAVADLAAARKAASMVAYRTRPLGYGKPGEELMAWVTAQDDLAYRLDGATSRTLPNGSVVEVEQVTWLDLMRVTDLYGPTPPSESEQAWILGAWNARHGVRAGASAAVETEEVRDDG